MLQGSQYSDLFSKGNFYTNIEIYRYIFIISSCYLKNIYRFFANNMQWEETNVQGTSSNDANASAYREESKEKGARKFNVADFLRNHQSDVIKQQIFLYYFIRLFSIIEKFTKDVVFQPKHNLDEFVKSLQFVLLVTFDPAPGGTKFASLNCKNSS